MKKEFKDACVEMCVGDIRPFTTFEGPHFEKVIQTAINLGAQHGPIEAKKLISDPTTISRGVAAAMADNKRHEVLPEVLKNIRNNTCAATTDLWTEKFNNHHYLTVTVHYLNDANKLVSRVLATEKFLDESETGENIANALKVIFAQYNIEQNDWKKIKFVTDGGANIVKALKIVGKQRLYCADHMLNVVLKSAFTLKLIDLDLYGDIGRDVIDLIELAVNCVKTLKLDRHLASKLQNIPNDSTSRRFKSIIPALESFLSHCEKVKEVLVSNGHSSIADRIDAANIEEMVAFLKPIETKARAHGNALEGVDLNWLSNHFAEGERDSAFLSALKAHARNELAILDTLILIAKCKKTVTYFKVVGLMNLLDVSLKQECETRWNSHLIMLLSFPQNFEKVNQVARDRGREDLVFTEDEQKHIVDLMDLISFLRIFKEQSEKLEADKKPTLPWVLIAYHRISNHCDPKPSDTSRMKKLRARTKALMEEKFVLSDLHKVACFLWPRFRRLKKLDAEERKQVYEKVKELCSQMSTTPTEQPEPTDVDSDEEGWRDDTGKGDELELYLNQDPGDDADVLQWWSTRATQYPTLAQLARSLLCIPATSASSERVFSTEGNIITARRSSLAPESVNNILFLHKHFKASAT